jgi:hypothetical protein
MLTAARTLDDSLELKLSLAVCLGLSGLYIVYQFFSEPSGGQPIGHWLGIIGTLLMVSTEVLYSLRKRTRWFKYGPVRHWLSAHIVTGLVGPFMVFMHSAFSFHGLAGFSLLITFIVVASGFVGRYLYTAIPHTIAGAAATSGEIAAEVARVQLTIDRLGTQRSAAVQEFIRADAQRRRRQRGDWSLVFLRGLDDWRYQRGLHARIRKLERSEKSKLGDVERLLNRRRILERQMRMMQAARRLLSVWHIAHVPMGVVLFGSAGIHTLATLVLGAGLWR